MGKTKFTDVHTKGLIQRPEWMHTDYLEYWLEDFVRDGSCLNMCSGLSQIGDVRVDIDPKCPASTMQGDLFKALETFRPESFDYVYCDPDFKCYNNGPNRIRWQFDLFKICKKALITRRPKITVNMPSKWHEYVIAEDSRPSFTIIRIDYK